jgi:hypothetical protein
MAFYGHDMLKSSHLLTNVPGLEVMRKPMTKDKKKAFTERFAEPSVYL